MPLSSATARWRCTEVANWPYRVVPAEYPAERPFEADRVDSRRSLVGRALAVAPCSTMKLRTTLCVAAALSAMTASCLAPGQYRIYRVAAAVAEQSTGCFPSSPGPDITGDSSTFRSGQTFAIYAADSDVFFMDLEALTLEGTKDGSDLSFHGESVDVQNLGGDTTLTVTTVMDVNVEIEGKKISGSSTLDVTQSCSGMNCPMPANSQCITTQSFRGSEVKDVELEHQV